MKLARSADKPLTHTVFGSSAFASAGTEQGISYAARRLKPLRWWGIGLAFGGSDVSAASA